MWQIVQQEISRAINDRFIINEKTRVNGGDINQNFHVSDANRHFFVKVNDKALTAMFDEEQFSLGHIESSRSIQVPKVICNGVTVSQCFLVLEYLPLRTANPSDWQILGESLASMHKATDNKMFGWDNDNYIGKTLQPNRWQRQWHRFFAEQRIGWQLQLLHEKGIQIADIDFLVEACAELLSHHQPDIALVHGDFWQGNIGFVNAPVTFDPACYYGDREVDIAMTELFGRFPNEFYQAYERSYPLLDSYPKRRDLYNLYHLLNHANLFGGNYVEQSKLQIEKLFF